MILTDRATRHHRLPALYDELKLPSDWVLHRRVSLLSDLAVMSQCGHPIECGISINGWFFYHCTTTSPASTTLCGLHQLDDATDIDRAVWTQLRGRQWFRRARTAYQRRSILLTRYALLRVSTDTPHAPVVDWIPHQQLHGTDRATAAMLADRRAQAATDRSLLWHAAFRTDRPYDKERP